MAASAPLLPLEFYHATLEASGLSPQHEDMVKFASEQKIPVHIAELAKRFFEQTQLDGIKYASPSLRMADSIAMAEAYVEHEIEAFTESAKTADALMTKVAGAVLEASGESCMSDAEVLEQLKAAALQLQSKIEFDKTAAIAQLPEVPTEEKARVADGTPTDIPVAAGEGAAVAPAAKPAPLPLDLAVHRPGEVWTGEGVDALARHAGGEHVDAKWLHGMLGLDPKDTDYHAKLTAAHAAMQSPGTSPLAALKAHATPTFMGRYGKFVIPGAAAALVGGGALYMMHRAKAKRDAELKDEIMRARANATA
jgi:hypothetical protein